MIKEYFKTLDSFLAENNRVALGYDDSELMLLEALIGVKFHGDFRAFLKKAGRSDGGLIGDYPIILYNEYINIRSKILSYVGFMDELINNDLFEHASGFPFVFATESETQHFFIKTKENDMNVFCYDENEETVVDTGMDFGTFMCYLVEKYNSERKANIICIGNMLSIPNMQGKQIKF